MKKKRQSHTRTAYCNWTWGKNGTWIHRRTAVGQSILGPIRPLALRYTDAKLCFARNSGGWKKIWTRNCEGYTGQSQVVFANDLQYHFEIFWVSFFDWQFRPETFHLSFQHETSLETHSYLHHEFVILLFITNDLLSDLIDLFSLNTSPAFIPNPCVGCMVPRILLSKIPMICLIWKEIQNGAKLPK